MTKRTVRWLLAGGALVLLLVLAACGGGGQPAPEAGGEAAAPSQEAAGSAGGEDVSAFFKGKNLDWIVPYSPGGGYDAYSRMVAPFFEKYTGTTVVIRNVPGAGSLTGTNQLYNSQPDGLTIGILNGAGTLQAQLTGDSAVQFDLREFTWLGRVSVEPRVLVAGQHSGFKTIDDLLQAGQTGKVRLGAPGVGSQTYLEAALFAEALGLNMELVTGYESTGDVDLAVIRGDLQAEFGSYSSTLDQIEAGDFIVLAQEGKQRSPELPDIPLVQELPGLTEEGKTLLGIGTSLMELGRPLAAPPGLPEDKTTFLRQALQKTLNDPELQKLAQDQERPLAYLSGPETEQVVRQALDMPAELQQKLTAALEKYK